VAVNVSAVLAAVELGVQPLLFHDAAGAPLYAPYPLHIAIPAMMLGHLTIAGMAEAALSAGLLRYMERNEPSLAPAPAGGTRKLRPALALPLLVLLTPLGILAGGAAWGEWAPQDFATADGRAQIAAASGHAAPPAAAPAGLERLANLWRAPMPQYAPQFARSEAFGYLISAMIGAGAILAVGWLARRLTAAARTAARTGETR
jgi:cobalt/nickel transport system permease protein